MPWKKRIVKMAEGSLHEEIKHKKCKFLKTDCFNENKRQELMFHGISRMSRFNKECVTNDCSP